MADFTPQLEQEHCDFILAQHIFFVGTAGAEGRVNVSPKGIDSFRILDPNTVLWLNLTGSGNESAGHVLENGRMTIMFCSYDRQPLILRIYGTARAIHEYDEEWDSCAELFSQHTGARQFFNVQVETVQTSCGYGVPLYDYSGERKTLLKYADNKGRDGIRSYWTEKNQTTIDGNPTGIF